MKKIFVYTILLLCSLTAGYAQKKAITLEICHTSDTHSRIEPLDPHANDRHAGEGGYARRYAFLQERRQENPDLLVFDCGDISQGTPYYNLFQGELEIKLMNLLGYDAMTIGNHEFDFGLDNMARLFKLAEFPIVCANYDCRGTVLEGLVKPYVVIKRKKVRIGVFGIAPALAGLVQASKCEGITYLDPVKSASRVIDELKHKEKCDVIICLSHLGIKKDMGDELLARGTKELDLILGGHTHTFMKSPRILKNQEGKDIPVFHCGRQGVQVSHTTLTLRKKK